MFLTAPSFWYRRFGLVAFFLSPLAWLYAFLHCLHQHFGKSFDSAIPVICAGNLVAGGSGKTPAAIALMELAQKENLASAPCFLSRGYKGAAKGPLLVDPDRHSAAEVGDEPLMLSRKAPAIIGVNRKKAARLAEERKFDLLIMDDGLQNPSLHKDVKFVVIDGKTGFGNGMLLPAGPLRTPLGKGLKQADAFILIGDDLTNIRRLLPEKKPVFNAYLEVPESWIADGTTPYVAFSGLAHPEKFHDTLKAKRLNIIGWHPFPDHHLFSENELGKLAAEIENNPGARLITTAKDAMRLPAAFTREHTLDILPVELVWEDENAVLSFLKRRLENAR